jgi:hypothetical protein
MTVTGICILIAFIFVLVLIFMELAELPGKTADSRNHPQADAIRVLGWLGLLAGFVPWLLAMVWAYMQPVQTVDLAAPPVAKNDDAGDAGDAGDADDADDKKSSVDKS